MKVLFISHDAARCGAQILLLNFLNWVKNNSSIPFDILLKKGGELESDFFRLSKCHVYKQPAEHEDNLETHYRKGAVGLVYSNTITNGDLLEQLSYLQCPIITHVHELENYIYLCGETNFNKVDRHTSLYIAASRAVKENLMNNHGITPERIRVVHEFIPTENYSEMKIIESREKIRQELSIPKNAFVIGASGTTDWRKSPELFVQLAGYMKRHHADLPLYFLWVGGHASWEIEYDISKLGLNTVRFVSHTSNAIDYFNVMDVFALVSRIDPYPLVCLEAASLGKPVICFDHAGGMQEFVEDDCGFVVPYLGIAEMAEKILLLQNTPSLGSRLGARGQQKVRERHDVSVAGREIIAIIKEYLR